MYLQEIYDKKCQLHIVITFYLELFYFIFGDNFIIFRAGFQTPGSCGSATVSQGTAGDVDSAIYPCYGYSGDEISLKSMPGIATQHPR